MDILTVDLVFFTIFDASGCRIYVARLFNTVNLIPMSIAKDGYPNRRYCFLQSLTLLDVEYYVAKLIETPQWKLSSNRHIDTINKNVLEF
jgi:hypothetical protein